MCHINIGNYIGELNVSNVAEPFEITSHDLQNTEPHTVHVCTLPIKHNIQEKKMHLIWKDGKTSAAELCRIRYYYFLYY